MIYQKLDWYMKTYFSIINQEKRGVSPVALIPFPTYPSLVDVSLEDIGYSRVRPITHQRVVGGETFSIRTWRHAGEYKSWFSHLGFIENMIQESSLSMQPPQSSVLRICLCQVSTIPYARCLCLPAPRSSGDVNPELELLPFWRLWNCDGK